MMPSGPAFSVQKLRLQGALDVLQLRRIARGALDQQCVLQGRKTSAGDKGRARSSSRGLIQRGASHLPKNFIAASPTDL